MLIDVLHRVKLKLIKLFVYCAVMIVKIYFYGVL